jgi:hypothetical protein
MAPRPLWHPEVLRQKTLGLHPSYRDAQIRLDDDDRAVLKRVNGQATVSTIAGLTRLADDVMVRIVLRLVARQKLVFTDELPWLDETALLAAVLERVEGRPAPRELRLDETDHALLAVVDGESRVRELVKVVPIERALVLVNVLRLLHAGLVRVNRNARPPQLRPERAVERTELPPQSPPPRVPAVDTRQAPGEPPGDDPASEPSTAEVWGRRPSSLVELAQRRVPRRWVALALLALGLWIAVQVAHELVDTVQTHLAGHALTVDGLADVIDLSEIRLKAGRRWTAVARSSFADRSRVERVTAAQELVRRVRAAGFRDLEVTDESGAVLFEYEASVLSIHDRITGSSGTGTSRLP